MAQSKVKAEKSKKGWTVEGDYKNLFRFAVCRHEAVAYADGHEAVSRDDDGGSFGGVWGEDFVPYAQG